MRKISLLDRLRYEFDNTMSQGTASLIGWLGIASAALILLVALVVSVTRSDPDSERGLGGLLWAAMLRTLDPGTMGNDRGSPLYLAMMLAITLGGIFIVGALIGILTTGLEAQIEELRKGRSFVAEENHTLILGWSAQIFTIISELVIANENQRRSAIVILAERDKVEMEDEIRAHVGKTGKTRVVCRSGNPIDLRDLETVNLHASRSIIVLAPPDSQNSDAEVIKCILAVTNNPNRHQEPYHMVAVIRDASNMEVARMVGGDEVQLVQADDLIARVAAQTCRQSGLSVAYTELMDFGGDEIYMKQEPSLVERSFGETLFAYETSAVIGIASAEGTSMVNPPMDTILRQGDHLVVIAEDDDTTHLSGLHDYQIDDSAIREAEPQAPEPERTLLLGWNHRAITILRELDQYVMRGSEILIVAEDFDSLENGKLTDQIMSASMGIANIIPDSSRILPRSRLITTHYENIKVMFQPGDITNRQTLDELQIPTFDHVVVLSYSDTLDIQSADARTLVTLLHLRKIKDESNRNFSIVSEMLDVRNRELAEVTHADDFIISDKILSLMLAQLSENRRLAEVFRDLFDAEGSEIYLKPVTDYVETGRPVNFYTVLEAARRRGQTALGYRLQAHGYNMLQDYGVRLNPLKSRMLTFSPEDKIIVLAEN